MDRILGLPYEELEIEPPRGLPLYITGRYDFRKITIADSDCVFIRPKTGLGTINSIEHQITKITEACNLPVAIQSETMSNYRRKILLEHGVPFVTDTQVFLPFIGTHLQKQHNKQPERIETFTVAAQIALIKWLLNPVEKVRVTRLMADLGYTAMTMSRVARQFVATGCFHIEKDGAANVLIAKYDAKATYEMVAKYMINPVAHAGYVDLPLEGDYIIAGTEAVSERTMLNPDPFHTYAAYGIDKSILQSEYVSPEKQVYVEIWKYDPRILMTEDGCADPISVALSLKGTTDERLEGTVEDMLKDVWR